MQRNRCCVYEHLLLTKKARSHFLCQKNILITRLSIQFSQFLNYKETQLLLKKLQNKHEIMTSFYANEVIKTIREFGKHYSSFHWILFFISVDLIQFLMSLEILRAEFSVNTKYRTLKLCRTQVSLKISRVFSVDNFLGRISFYQICSCEQISQILPVTKY